MKRSSLKNIRMAFHRRSCEIVNELVDGEVGCEVTGPQNRVGDVTSGLTNDDPTAERLELPVRKNSRSFFGTLKKRFASSFNKKRPVSHNESTSSYNLNSASHESPVTECGTNHVNSSKRERGLKLSNRARAKSSGDISCEGHQHSNGSLQNGVHQNISNNSEESCVLLGELSDRATDQPRGRRNDPIDSTLANASSNVNSKLSLNGHVPQVSNNEVKSESSYGFYTKIPPVYDQVKTMSEEVWCLTKELLKLSKYGWYWGPISRMEAEEKLADQDDGSFLVRDSSDERYLLSLSFRSAAKTLHTRVEHCNGVFSFYAQPESEGYSSIVDLIENSMTDSEQGIFCYSRARYPGSPAFPVRLTKPLSRFAQVRTLQYSCRFVIRQSTRFDHIQSLPLPTSIKGWLTENQY